MDKMVSADEAREMAEACSYATTQPWEMEDDGDDYVIFAPEAAVEVARVRHAEGAETDAQHIVNAVNFAPRACATIAALHAILDGRADAPTDAELAAHDLRGGRWLIRNASGSVRAEVMSWPSSRDWHVEQGAARWWPLDADGRPCAWPEVTP